MQTASTISVTLKFKIKRNLINHFWDALSNTWASLDNRYKASVINQSFVHPRQDWCQTQTATRANKIDPKY